MVKVAWWVHLSSVVKGIIICQAYNVCRMDSSSGLLWWNLDTCPPSSLLTPDLCEYVAINAGYNNCFLKANKSLPQYLCMHKKCKIKPSIQVFMTLEWHRQIQMLPHSLSVVEQSIQICFYPFHSIYCVLKHITGHVQHCICRGQRVQLY